MIFKATGLFYDTLGRLNGIAADEEVIINQDLPSPYGPRGPPTITDLNTFALSHSWQGLRQDPTQLIYIGARHYDPSTGRFLSPDPIGYPHNLNLYSYANGDPINFRDPSGRFASHVHETTKSSVIDTLSNPNVQGTMQIVGGLAEAWVGGAYSLSTGVWGH